MIQGHTHLSHDSSMWKRKWLPASVVRHVELIRSIAAMVLACNLLSSETMDGRETELYVCLFLKKVFCFSRKNFSANIKG